MTFRPTIPATGPAWLPAMADSISNLFRRILPAPLRLFRSRTADLPVAAAHAGGLLWDADEETIAQSDGSAWKYFSFSDHIHGAGDVVFAPAGSLAATDVQAAIEELDGDKAPLASPAFTGTPTAPTAAAGTDTTQIATTAYVRSEIAALVDTAPGTLDTLNELAAALGDDPNFATTVTNALAAKLDDSQASAFGLTLLDDADAATARTTLGLGTAAVKNSGTSGDAVPLLNAANIWGEAQSIVKSQNAQTTLYISNANSGASASATIDFGNGALGANDRAIVGLTGTGYTAIAGWQDAGILATAPNVSGGTIINANAAAGIKFEVGGYGSTFQRARIHADGLDVTGILSVGGTTSCAINVGPRSGSGTSVIYNQSGDRLGMWIAGSDRALLTTTAFSCVSATTAAAANVHQASSGSALLRSTSSERYKQNITPLAPGQADKVLDLAPIVYRSRAEADYPNRTFWGFTAEQAHQVLPALVNYDAEGSPDGFQYERVVVGLVSVVKRLEARVAALEAA